MKKLRVGIIGAGRIGKVHTESISRFVPDARILAISDVSVDGAKGVAEKFGIPKVHASHRAILDDKEIDAVVICSPTNTHAQYVEEAAAAGKDIFCEKPIDLSVQVIRRALAAVKKAGVKLMVGFNRRFDPNFAKIREMVVAGTVGDVQLVRITSRDPSPPPAQYVAVSGGIYLDMTIHDFDMARYVSGKEVVEVFAKGSVLVDPAIGKAGDVDTTVVLLTFEDGAICAIDNSRQAVYGYDQRVEVFGSKGAAIADNRAPVRYTHLDAAGSHGPHIYNFFMDRYTEAYALEMVAFCKSVMEGTPLPVSGEDGLVAVRIGLAAKRSAAENRPVRVDEIADVDHAR